MSKKEKGDPKFDKRVKGDENIIQGNISGGVVVQGRNPKVTVHNTIGAELSELTALFEQLQQAILARPEDPDIDKEEIVETVQKIEIESQKGEQANPKKVERWVQNLNNMAPDIVDVILASLGGPVSGFTAILKNISKHARQSTSGKE